MGITMTSGWSGPRKAAAALALAGLAASMAGPAQAQDDAARMRQLESEVRALQRAVFPNGGDRRFFPPEVTPGAQPVATPDAPPSSTPLTDVLARLDSLEAQVQRLTAQSEEKDNALAQLQKRFDEAQAAQPAASVDPDDAPTPAAALSGRIPLPSLSTTSTTSAASSPRPTPAPSATAPRATPTPATSTSRTSATAQPSAARLAAVRAIEKPQTADAGDDEYSYGFRLYNAGFFPEARQQLAMFLQKYPTHQRVSYARNLLGRAYLDDAQPREAAKYFFENYQNGKQGARAPDSLLNLADAMIAISDTNRACIALAEFGDTYPALATGRLKEQYDRTKSKVRCTK
jgi:TolA-binding protein